MTHYRVLIVGTHPGVVSDVPPLFQRAGCRVDIFAPKGGWQHRNHSWHRWISAGNVDDGTYATQLQALVDRENYDWVVLGDDGAVGVMGRTNCDDALARKILPLSKLENKIMLGSKAGLSILCDRYSIVTPPYVIYNEAVDLNVQCSSIPFPILLKEDCSGGSDGVHLCATVAAVERLLAQLPTEKKHNLVFQSYIVGDNIAVDALYQEGGLLGYAYSQATRSTRGEFGVAIERRYVACPEIEAELSGIGASFGINGFATMTFIRCKKTQQHYLIESDLRPQGWFPLARFCGVDFVQAISNYFSRHPVLLRPMLPKNKSHVMVQYFIREFVRYLRQRDVAGMMRWCLNWNGCWRYIPWHNWRMMSVSAMKRLFSTHAR